MSCSSWALSKQILGNEEESMLRDWSGPAVFKPHSWLSALGSLGLGSSFTFLLSNNIIEIDRST